MEIGRFKNHHREIFDAIHRMRRLAHAGISRHASDIAEELGALSRVVTQHLAIEDRILYPTVQRSAGASLADMARSYQDDMKGIANAYIAFSRRWQRPGAIASDGEAFRREANTVLRDLHARMLREDREFYPAIEAM